MTSAASPNAPPGLARDLDSLNFAVDQHRAGARVALVTIVGLDGPFSRPLGAQLAVTEDGRFVGSVSGGCLEAALTEEAMGAIRAGRNRTLRYGVGSPYIDVRLPCGGGIDLVVDAAPDMGVLERAVALGNARKPFALAFDPLSTSTSLRLLEQAAPYAGSGGEFVRRFDPGLRLVLAGRGWEIVAMARLARQAASEIVVASQESATLDYCRPHAERLIHLTTPTNIPPMPIDDCTAVACLFHEHEWEIGLLMDALRSPAFYVGALGSRQTHARRLETLRALGLGPDDLERLKGPIGVFRSYDPMSLSISALAEIVDRHAVAVGRR